jgi:fructokinase
MFRSAKVAGGVSPPSPLSALPILAQRPFWLRGGTPRPRFTPRYHGGHIMSEPLFGGIEAGGTKFVCAVGRGEGPLLAEERIPTTTPAETIARVVAFFHGAAALHGECNAFGVATFGPVDLDPRSPGWGRLTRTPKPGWVDVDLVGPLRAAFGAPVAIDTDVNGAGLAEAIYGAGRGARALVYVTVGTGIGGGAIVDGTPLRGLSHPEMGHVPVPRHPDDEFEGVCPFHGACLEGLASGPAIRARWGAPAESLPDDHPAWEIIAFYLAHLAVSATMFLSPEVIVIGGGVAKSAPVLPAVRRWTASLLGGYPQLAALEGPLDRYIVPPLLGDRAGVRGALALAARATATA